MKSTIGIFLCIAGGYIGGYLFVKITYLFTVVDIGFGLILYGFLPGVIITYLILRRFFPSLVGNSSAKGN